MEMPVSIQHNLGFLFSEVLSRLESTRSYLDDTSPEAAEEIFSRSGYLANLKLRIHDDCYRYITGMEKSNMSGVLRVRAVDVIAAEIERIADLCEEFVQQLVYYEDPEELNFPKLRLQLDLVTEAVEKIETALEGNDTQLAVKIGRTQDRLERRFGKLLKKNAASLRDTADAEKLLTISLGAYAIERMGDSLLRISEAIISSSLGIAMDSNRYQGMQESVSKLSENRKPVALQVQNVAETRSGAVISSVQLPGNDERTCPAIYKQGLKKKLKMERKGVENWHDVFPGLAPQILAWRKQGKSASLLIEHLSGSTFEQIVLNEPGAMLQQALDELERTLHDVWNETLSDKPVSAGFMHQLDKRISDVYAVHPEFQRGDQLVCGCRSVSFESLVKAASPIESCLTAPFSVYIHGDFNIDNVIYDPDRNQIHYVDLHRSRYMDYVQDVSVFMVSNYRLQVLDRRIRMRIATVINRFYRIAVTFARSNDDEQFEIRLAFGLVRSLATSTRFILDRSLARDMFQRAHYLLQQIVNLDPDGLADYRVPVEDLFHG